MKVTTDGCLFGAWCAREIKSSEFKMQNALDIGTGTGLLSLMIAQKNDVVIDAVEIDEQAAAQAGANVAGSPFSTEINVVHQNILDFEKQEYDFIISNPPFYENELTSPSVTKNTAHHSYELSWKTLFSIIGKKLKDTGKFFLLLPAKRWKEVEELLKRQNLCANKIVFVKQSPPHSAFRILLQGSKGNSEPTVEELTICDTERKYTSPFKELLKDYYLKL